MLIVFSVITFTSIYLQVHYHLRSNNDLWLINYFINHLYRVRTIIEGESSKTFKNFCRIFLKNSSTFYEKSLVVL